MDNHAIMRPKGNRYYQAAGMPESVIRIGYGGQQSADINKRQEESDMTRNEKGQEQKKIPSVTILSSTEPTARETEKQLRRYFGGHAGFRWLLLSDSIAPASIKDDMVLVTNESLLDRALPAIAEGTPYLVTKRMISAETVVQLYRIPAGTDMIVFNVTRKNTEECLTQLQELGITHLHLHPAYPEMETWPSGCPYLITFGEAALVPPGDYTILDLDVRPIDTPSCVKLAIQLDIYEKVWENLSVAAILPILKMSRHLSERVGELQQAKGTLQMILDRSEDSVLLLDENREILFFNPEAEKLLDIRQGKSLLLNQIFPAVDMSHTDYFVPIRGKNYHVKAVISYEEESAGQVLLTIRDMEELQEIDRSYRINLQKSGFTAKHTFRDIVYSSEKMKTLLAQCRQFARSNSTVAIYGQSGCGKELIAQAIHNASARKDQAFVAVNFAALSSSVCESELFGYEEGAFTGARRGGQKGLFEAANHGTIFLDEIGDCPLDVQKKILRVIQERNVMPVGSNRLIPLDIRIIAATNQDLFELTRQHLFREDLYYRLNVLPVYVPALNERREDILPLFLYFLNERFGLHVTSVPDELKECLLQHSWRGNIRELQNVAEYIANCMVSDVPWQQQRAILFADRPVTEQMVPGKDTDGMRDLLRKLEQESDFESLKVFLETVSSPPGIWSRDRLLSVVQQRIPCSLSRIKHLTMVLKQQGLVQARTGYGTYLTEEGRRFLACLQEEPGQIV